MLLDTGGAGWSWVDGARLACPEASTVPLWHFLVSAAHTAAFPCSV